MAEKNFRDIPGTVKVIIQPYQEGDPRFDWKDADGKLLPPGYRLADLVEEHGERMTVIDPFRSEPYDVSLVAFAGLPGTTRLRFTYEFHPDPAFVLAHPDKFT